MGQAVAIATHIRSLVPKEDRFALEYHVQSSTPYGIHLHLLQYQRYLEEQAKLRAELMKTVSMSKRALLAETSLRGSG